MTRVMIRTAVLVSVGLLTVAACSGGSEVTTSASFAPVANSTSTTVVDTTTTVITSTVAPTSTAAPTTLAPATTVAPTTVPVTAAPTTAAPAPAPTTTVAVTTVPVTAAPTTLAPPPPTTVACRVAGLNDIVRRGDCGDTVRFIQDRLTVLGFPAVADGQFGPGTETAVKNFQTSRGLVADGIVGPLTWDKLVEGGIGD